MALLDKAAGQGRGVMEKKHSTDVESPPLPPPPPPPPPIRVYMTIHKNYFRISTRPTLNELKILLLLRTCV